VRAAGVVLATLLALTLQTTIGRFVTKGATAIDLVLVVVGYAALVLGPVAGLLAGAFGGLIQDVLSGSVIGIGGLAKTVVGFLAGVVGTQFIVAQPLPRFVALFGATIVHAVIFMGLYALLDLRQFGTPYAEVAGQAAGNAIVGVLAFQVAELLPGAVERRKASKSKVRR